LNASKQIGPHAAASAGMPGRSTMLILPPAQTLALYSS
jgi:hypothetical protein